MTTTPTETDELLSTLARHRGFLIQTTVGLGDDQARSTPTVSALSLGGIVKHVIAIERQWVAFVQHGPSAFAWDAADAPDAAPDDAGLDPWSAGFVMLPGETLAGLLADYAAAAAETEAVVRSLADLTAGHPLPSAPWFEPGAVWSARRVLLHLIAETAQHSGHADIIRETIDGAKTLG